MNEEAFKQTVFEKLKQHFNIAHEVNGKHFSGNNMRIDAIATPKENNLWKNHSVALGIEFKDDERLRGDTTNYTGWLAQCIDYSNTKWDRFGYIYIFTCPGLSDSLSKHIGQFDLLPHIMGHLGIGELKFDERYGLTFFLQGQHRIWSQVRGVEMGKSWDMKRKFGSR